MLTVFMMAVPTTLIGLMPTYAAIGIAAPIILLVLRMLQGVRSRASSPAPRCS